MSGWSAYCSLIWAATYSQNSKDVDLAFVTSVLTLGISGILFTHLQRWIMIRLGWLNRKLPPLVPRLLISSALTACMITLTSLGVAWFTQNSDNELSELNPSDVVINIVAMGILTLFWNAIYFTVHFFRKSRSQEMSNLELAASNRESELKNLRSQLNPHFLFNSLNGIRALVDIDPGKAKVSITTLSNLLRKSLLMGKEMRVPLESEVEIAQNYLDLGKIRFEERLNISWDIDGELLRIKIPPFVLQMMVENAIKHGISNLKEGGDVNILVKQSREFIFIEVQNSGELQRKKDIGLGIANIKQRLHLQYGEKAAFSIREEDNMVVAQIQFSK